MISLTTAKLLLLVALCLGPKYADSNHTILITSKNSTYNCVWTQKPQGWNLDEKVLPTYDWPANGLDVSTQELNTFGRKTRPIVRAVIHHDWKHDGVLILDNGDRIEKRGSQVFYTVNTGAPNEVVYTILTIENGKPL